MSNHFSLDNLKFPGDDRRLDLTDVFAFESADDPDKTVLSIDTNPTSAPPPISSPTTGPEFHPDAVYRINIDNNGDAKADVAFTFTFTEFEDGRQTGTAWYAAGNRARWPEPAGEQLTGSLLVSFDGLARPVQVGPIRLSAGRRSGRFFADAQGARPVLGWAGVAGNVDSIALEVPSDMLGAGPVIGVWASISLRRNGRLVQLSRGGHPTIDPFLRPGGEKAVYHSRQPVDDVANYLGPWSKVLENDGYSPEEAKAAARQVLPDILRYDRTKPAAYPNGRALTDDVYSARFPWLSNANIPSADPKPPAGPLARFPYLAPPNYRPQVSGLRRPALGPAGPALVALGSGADAGVSIWRRKLARSAATSPPQTPYWPTSQCSSDKARHRLRTGQHRQTASASAASLTALSGLVLTGNH
jgi:Domain of unknown function (DUF4331)